MHNSEVVKLILDSLKKLNVDLKLDELSNPDAETKIFGKEGTLDSLGIMKLISIVEMGARDTFEKNICLTDEKNFTGRVGSPFRSVGEMAEFVNELLNNAKIIEM